MSNEYYPYPYKEYKMTGLFEYEDRFASIIGMMTNERTLSVTHYIEDRVRSNPQTTVLELGFGEGYFLEDLAGIVPVKNVYGIDLQSPIETIARIVKMHPGIHLKQGDVHNLLKLYTTKHGLQQFDIIIGSNLAIWLYNPINALLVQGNQLLKPGGVLLINTFPLAKAMPNEEDRKRFIEATTREGWKWNPRGNPPTSYDIAVCKLPENSTNIEGILGRLEQIPYNHKPTHEHPVTYRYC